MHYEAFEDGIYAPDWRVEGSAPEDEGDVFVTLFSGPQAEKRAKEYCSWKNSQVAEVDPTRGMLMVFHDERRGGEHCCGLIVYERAGGQAGLRCTECGDEVDVIAKSVIAIGANQSTSHSAGDRAE